jgi:hypothetical protein
MWRAFLADGSIVQYDGTNSPQEFLNQIVRFDVLGKTGPLVSLTPESHQRVIFRWVREHRGAGQATVAGMKVGLLDKNQGAHEVYLLTHEGRERTDDFVLTPEEMA